MKLFGTIILLGSLYAQLLRGDESGTKRNVLVTAKAKFSVQSPKDEGIALWFFYTYGSVIPDGPLKRYVCPWEDMEYSISTPKGRIYTIKLVDKKKDSGNSTHAFFNLGSYKIFDAKGVWPGHDRERRFFWAQKDVPDFAEIGNYTIVESGTFIDPEGEMAQLPFRSSEARFRISDRVIPLEELKKNAQQVIQRQIITDLPQLSWFVTEDERANRLVSAVLSEPYYPESKVPKEAMMKEWNYDGVKCRFIFNLSGRLLSWSFEPMYWID